MKKLNTKGFGAIEALLIVVIVGVIGGVGYFVYNSQKKTSKPLDNAANSQTEPQNTSTPDNTTTVSAPDKYAGNLVIKEWGLRMNMKDADKVTYEYHGSGLEDDKGQQESYITLVVKPDYLQDKTCTVSVGITRYKSVNSEFFIGIAKKIGDYYYIGGGSPYSCGNEADDALNKSARTDFDYKNLQTL